MDAPFYISTPRDPLRDRIFKKRSTEATNVSTDGFCTPQTTIARCACFVTSDGPELHLHAKFDALVL